METLLQVLPIILYSLGAILLVVLIILGIKLIQSVDKTNKLLDDVQKKVSSLDALFHIIDTMTDTLSGLTERVVDLISGTISKIFKRKKIKEEDYE